MPIARHPEKDCLLSDSPENLFRALLSLGWYFKEITMESLKYSIATHGDMLEKHASDFIATHLPAYEQIWLRYIGHDGQGQMAKLIHATSADDDQRAIFSQHHYTILESSYFMHKIAEDYSEGTRITTFDGYRKLINDIMAFQAYSGRLIDNINRCAEKIGNSDFASDCIHKLKIFYFQRHIFIHGCKIPFSVDEGIFKMPSPKRDKDARVGYGQSEPWYTIHSSDMLGINNYLHGVMRELLPIVNSILYSMLPKVIPELMDENGLELEPPKKDWLSHSDNGTSIGPQGPLTFISASGMPPSEE